MKTALLLLSIFITSPAVACFAPTGGDKYDSQIEVQKLEEKNRYRVTVPRYMEDMPNEAEIILAYSIGHSGGIPVYDKYDVLKPAIQGKSLVVEFVVEKKEKKPYIVVMWWPEYSGMCGIQANSPYLEVD